MEKRKESELAPEAPQSWRVRLDSAGFVHDGDSQWAEVALSYAGRQATKRSPCPDCELVEDKIRSVVEATLAAMEEISGHRLACDLVDYDVVRAFGGEYIVVLVDLTIGGHEYQVFGRCRERDELAGAAARATLDAANQFLRQALSAKDEG
jgi:hypothetical protein